MKTTNYYEVLGVAPHVGVGQIQAAYRFARSLYSGEGMATYGMLDAEERTRMLALVEQAYAALSNPTERRSHDLGLIGARPLEPVPADPNLKARPSQKRTPSQDVPRPQPAPEAATIPLKVPEFVNGAALKALREARNLSIDQIAALTKVGGRFLIALEEDRHKALPARVFARGFLTEYARALRVSDTELVERYLRNWPLN